MIQQLNNFLRIEYINNGEKIEFLNAMKFYYAKKKRKNGNGNQTFLITDSLDVRGRKLITAYNLHW